MLQRFSELLDRQGTEQVAFELDLAQRFVRVQHLSNRDAPLVLNVLASEVQAGECVVVGQVATQNAGGVHLQFDTGQRVVTRGIVGVELLDH